MTGRAPVGGLTPEFSRTPHLVALVADAERLATLLREALAHGRVDDADADALRHEAVLASLRLDGSPLHDDAGTLDELLASRPEDGNGDPDDLPPDDLPEQAAGKSGDRGGGWLDAFGQRLSDGDILRREYAGLATALEADDLAASVLTAPLDTLAALHRHITRGLVPPDHAGRPRKSRQAVQDGSVGRVLYHAEEPERIPHRLALLEGWLTSAAAREHGVLVSGVVHHELLHIHPFEAANGRTARAAARLVLRARDLDPAGLAVAETLLATDPLGYYEDVPATIRRRDFTVWLERWGEAVVGGLRRSARHLGLLDAAVPSRAATFLDHLAGDDFTVADYRADAGTGPEDARADLDALLDAGRIERVAGSRGLRYVVRRGD